MKVLLEAPCFWAESWGPRSAVLCVPSLPVLGLPLLQHSAYTQGPPRIRKVHKEPIPLSLSVMSRTEPRAVPWRPGDGSTPYRTQACLQ